MAMVLREALKLLAERRRQSGNESPLEGPPGELGGCASATPALTSWGSKPARENEEKAPGQRPEQVPRGEISAVGGNSVQFITEIIQPVVKTGQRTTGRSVTETNELANGQ